MKHWWLILLTGLGFLTWGCAPQSLVLPLKSGVVAEHVVEKDYSIGTERTAYVGEPLIQLKDFVLLRSRVLGLRALEDFEIHFQGERHSLFMYGPETILPVANGTQYPVRGRYIYRKKDYFVVDLSGFGPGTYSMLVDSTGAPQPIFLKDDKIARGIEFVPGDVLLELLSTEEVDPHSEYVDFELLYGGTDEAVFTLLYREYTHDDLQEPRFSQDLTYSLSEKQIRLRGMSLSIHAVDNQRVRFTVVADDLFDEGVH